MASVRHGMVTRSFDRVQYKLEAIDKNGKAINRTANTITALDDKALKEEIGQKFYREGYLVISMDITSREPGLYGQTIEQFIANAVKLK